MRTFLAVELPGEVRDALAAAQRRLEARIGGWRWTRAGGIHLTLRFLGEATPESLERARPLWRAAAAASSPLAIRVAGLGVFPAPRRARVLWAGVTEEPDGGHLAALARSLESACREAGFPPETRAFTPHLTLARAAGERAQAPGADDALDAGRADVREIVLFRSELLPKGAVHTPLDRFPLGGGGA